MTKTVLALTIALAAAGCTIYFGDDDHDGPGDGDDDGGSPYDAGWWPEDDAGYGPEGDAGYGPEGDAGYGPDAGWADAGVTDGDAGCALP